MGAVGSGVDYMYLDSSLESWQMSGFMINVSQGAVANTLNQLYMGEAYKVRSLLFSWPSYTDLLLYVGSVLLDPMGNWTEAAQ